MTIVSSSRWTLCPVPGLRGVFFHMAVLASCLLGLGWLAPEDAAADPDYGRLVLPGLDPVLAATKDPRLLATDRLLVRQRLLDQGVDPLRAEIQPDLYTSFRQKLWQQMRVNLERTVTVVEANGFLGLVTVFEYPEYYFLFQTPETLPGGFIYYPPRPVDAEEVELFVDDLALAQQRKLDTSFVQIRSEKLDMRGGGAGDRAREGLLNLTIPIKLPRTLEKIIGRGEKTNIRISGRQRISLAGESSWTNQDLANERSTGQSKFPSLDMEQQLQINLSGTIGEKIKIEVDHNSEIIGPDGTKIRLRYEGNEDEIIQTIETGDVGLTLPGSQLLGYSSNKSGLFGFKVTGQVGRADFTWVASKQKAESAAKSFNARGGEVTEHVIEAHNYLRNRFFRLDLPRYVDESGILIHAIPDDPGRGPGEYIWPSSVQVYQFIGSSTGQPGDIDNVALYEDRTGLWDEPGGLSSQPGFDWTTSHAVYGQRWRPVTFDPLLDQDGNVIAIDLQRTQDDYAILGVIYTVVTDLNDPENTIRYQVGDRPGLDESDRIDINGVPHLRMKLLKPQTAQAYTFQYMLKNIYPLGGSNIDPQSFDLRIELNDQSLTHPNLDRKNGNLDWFRIFGLDLKNPQGNLGADGLVDKEDPFVFDLQRGILKFPETFPRPFDADSTRYHFYAQSDSFVFARSALSTNLIPEIYDPETLPQNYDQYNRWRLVASHASAASSFSLGASNIEEGSESVVVNGRTLQRGVDYEIDYTFGEITLKGDAANLPPDAQIQVDYQYAPFFGGGKSSLLGFNLGYDLGRESKLSTTWLYETNQIAGHKAKLGEEPSKNLVGNMNLQHTFRPYFLTHIANLLSRRDSEKESTLQINGEAAVSLPNPNTKGDVFLEDFEGIDASNQLSMTRLGWYWASPPAQGDDPDWVNATGDSRDFNPQDRVPANRWFIPKNRVQRNYLNPGLVEQEARETQQALQIFLEAGPGGWQPNSWGGIMRGLGRIGLDLTKSQFLEFWLNDFQVDPASRSGKLHIDFGFITEDFYWEVVPGVLEIGTYQHEEDGDGVFVSGDRDNTEDTGLDGVRNEFPDIDDYDAEYVSDGNPFPQINGTEKNNREDTEDLNDNTIFDQANGYFSITVDLADTSNVLVDVLRDYDNVGNLVDIGQAWRKFRINLGEATVIRPTDGSGTDPSISAITHVRIWFEDADSERDTYQFQISEFKFTGSRWEREGVRKKGSEQLLSEAERGPFEGFFIGEVNNKENPDYHPPFPVHEENRIQEKEQSLVLDYQELERDHVVRISKVLSPQGDDYTQYSTLTWWLFNPSHEFADMDYFFRVGADTLNFYEISYRFSESRENKTGWKAMEVDMAELTNVKFQEPDPETGWIQSFVTDPLTAQQYRVRIVGRPDLRRVKRFYFGAINDSYSSPVTGYVYFNDIKAVGVKRDMGAAERIAMRLNMADVIKVDFDWSFQDAEFHGLNAKKGQGYSNEDWNLSANARVDDFIPLFGFRLPVSVSRRQTIQRPKYLTNSDIELIDQDIVNQQSTVDERESFSARLSHNPSRAAIPRFFIDPWTFSVSGSRSTREGPLERASQLTWQGAATYDLRISGRHTLAKYPILGMFPLVRSVAILPSKITLSGNFNGSEREAETVNEDGTATPRPTAISKRGTLSGSMEYSPLGITTLSFNARSDRDLLRRYEVYGVNIGEENQYQQDLRMVFTPPKASELPSGPFFAPVRTLFKVVNQTRPNVTYNGSYTVNRDPSIRQLGDPPDIRSVSNSGDWEFRLRLPIDEFAKSLFPERKQPSATEREQILERERQLQRRRQARDQGRPPEPGGTGELPPPEGEEAAETGDQPEVEELTPEEKRQREEEALLEAAREREEQLQRERGEEAPPAEAEDQQAQPEIEPAADQPVGQEGGRLKIPNPLSPILHLLRNTSPIQASLTQRRTSSYARLLDAVPFWYQVGLQPSLDTTVDQYATSRLTDRLAYSLSTNTKVTRQVSLDVKYNKSTSSQDQAGLLTKSLQEDWPDARVSLTGLERWSIFGGKGEEGGFFSSSNIDVSYKKSLTVNNYTATQYNPRTTKTISPRWNFTFRNGMSVSINVGLTDDLNLTNGTETRGKRQNYGLQLRHSFRAERLLAKVGLYKPGSTPTINMDLDVNYAKDTNQRIVPGSTVGAVETGSTRFSINPRFSYQITRSLSGALRLTYSRNRSIESDTIRTSLGLGLEATFVF